MFGTKQFWGGEAAVVAVLREDHLGFTTFWAIETKDVINTII